MYEIWNFYVCMRINYIGCLYEFSNGELMKLLILKDLTAQLLRAFKGIGKTGILYVIYFKSKCLTPPEFKNFVVI